MFDGCCGGVRAVGLRAQWRRVCRRIGPPSFLALTGQLGRT
jgi:hypothetical protein